MKHLDLFSGIGGFALAARWVGWETIGFCEIDPWCRKILAKHWPGVPIYEDIRRLVADPNIRYVETEKEICTGRDESRPCSTDGQTTIGPVDIITGGFPCQDISYAGKGAGIDGERSGLWTELARVIGEVHPRFAVLENVSALLTRGLERVLFDLSEIGYDAEWHCIPASAVGAPHRRDRIWIIAYPNEQRGCGRNIAQSDVEHDLCESTQLRNGKGQTESDVANADQPRLEGRLREVMRKCAGERAAGQGGDPWDGNWLVEPAICGMVDGTSDGLYQGRVAKNVPDRVNRLRGLGNAIVPQVAQVIFEAIDEL